MSFFSQIGIVLLIAGITIILLRTNRDLERACEEGEHFVDEWAMLLEKERRLKGRRPGEYPKRKGSRGEYPKRGASRGEHPKREASEREHRKREDGKRKNL